MKDIETRGCGVGRRSYLYGGVITLSGLAGCVGASDGRAEKDDRTSDPRAADGPSSGGQSDGEERTDQQEGERTETERTTIAECMTITEPGRYALETDLEAEPGETCIEIRTSDVTLDGQGYAISGPGPTEPNGFDSPLETGTAGVLVQPGTGEENETKAKTDKKKSNGHATDGLSNVTVRNLAIEGFDAGIAFDEVTAGSIAETTTSGNRYGISLLRSAENALANNDAFANVGHGIRLENADGNRLEANAVNDNSFPAEEDSSIFFLESNENTLVANDVDGNITGIRLENSHENTFEENTVSDNIFDGVVLIESSANTLVRNTVNGNTNLIGISLVESHGNTIRENTANGNADCGISLLLSDENALIGNTANSNGFEGGILLAWSDGNTLSNNTANDNESGFGDPTLDEFTVSPGFNLFNSSVNEGRANTARGNEGGPIQIVGGAENSIEVNGVLYTEPTASGETNPSVDQQTVSSAVVQEVVETGDRESVLQMIEEASE
ncbi:hypothetical protein GWG54_05215 [Natronococcus sp. JC468]|uniref:right-handed parallel beta-helix repeat-containing protein n=1 Tax=Natronococcus sp. JC468 TaxID=1961921 RepID=UPI00143A1575|nr:right-handed parallel beta-helix repeat-containing protein [Natronococcus sp. JC468]NKE35223.1 hypothetical protein [Natronococcus sp. JC468]